jgi:hypothetical protein
MPRWEVHLTVASMVVLVIATGSALGLYQAGLSTGLLIEASSMFHSLLLGSFALLLGSVLPDLDGKGKIRWTIGPVMGAFALAPPFLGRFSLNGPEDALDFIWNEGSRLFLLLTGLGYLLILVPMKHRGWMHSNTPGLIFGTASASYVLACTSFGIHEAILVGVLGSLGYFWHLALDGELTL